MKLKTIAFIFARGGSKGLKNKNLLKINNKPLIAHSIDLAKEIKEIDKIFVSTDSLHIKEAAQHFGAEIIMRPRELATDNSPEWLSWQHAISYVNTNFGVFNKFLSLPPTAPLRRIEDIKKCLNSLKKGIDIIVTMTDSQRNPWFNMVIKKEDGSIELINPNSVTNRRQDAPKCFDLCTAAYISKPEFILKNTSIWDGNVKGIEIPIESAIDIDTNYDFQIASHLINVNLKNDSKK